jgi:hypothetical protein
VRSPERAPTLSRVSVTAPDGEQKQRDRFEAGLRAAFGGLSRCHPNRQHMLIDVAQLLSQCTKRGI